METTQVCNGLVVIESLPANGLQTGTSLVEHLTEYCTNAAIPLWHAKTPHKAELVAVFERLVKAVAAEPRFRPIVHVEAHGNDKGTGIVLADGEFIDWDGFASLCRRVNEATKNNLLVVMATCYGYNSISPISLREVTPYCTLIGPTSTVTAREIWTSSEDFYLQLFNTGDLTSALGKLPAGFTAYVCEQMFVRVWRRYLYEFCSGRRRKERIERLVTELVRRNPEISLKLAREECKRLTRGSKQTCQKFHASFLMSRDPENAGRFDASLAEALAATLESPETNSTR